MTTCEERRPPVPEQSQVQTGDLLVVRTPTHTMLLAGLPPVYAHGLSGLLAAAGLQAQVVPDLPQLTTVLPDAGPCVVVVPLAQTGSVVSAVALQPGQVLVVLVDVATAEVCATALRAGVTGILTFEDAPEDVVTVLQAAARGRVVLPREVVQSLCRPEVVEPPSLTSTEQDWLRRLAAGGTVAGLARSCGYSEREMYRRLSAVYLRLGARTRTEALLLAERFGFLTRPRDTAGR